MVTRETVQAVLEARGVDAGSAEASALVSFAALLLEHALPAGWIGPEEGGRVLDRHILDCADLARHMFSDGPMAFPRSVVDVGSGAGLPGVVLAILLPHRVTMVEARRDASAFIRRVCRTLGLDASVVTSRAEDLARDAQYRESFAVATARAAAPPLVALELCLPLLAVGGRCVLPVGRSAAALRDDLAHAGEALGGGEVEMVEREVPGGGRAGYVIIVPKVEHTPERFPRRPSSMRRRPIGS